MTHQLVILGPSAFLILGAFGNVGYIAYAFIYLLFKRSALPLITSSGVGQCAGRDARETCLPDRILCEIAAARMRARWRSRRQAAQTAS